MSGNQSLKEVPVGFQNIRLQFTLDTDATEEQLATLLRLTERYCVVYQTLAHPPVLAVARKRAAACAGAPATTPRRHRRHA